MCSSDLILPHSHRLDAILNQLEQFVNRQYTNADLARFQQAADHNQQLLQSFQQTWPTKLKSLLEQIAQL